MSTQPNQQKSLNAKNAQKCKKLSNIEKFFIARFAHSAFYKIHILYYHISMLFAYVAGGEGGGVGLEVLKCFVRGG